MMRNTLLFILLPLFIYITIFVQSTTAQNYTQWELPDEAIARLGKGRINDMQYSPDGTILAVATTIGIWIYDTDTYQEQALLSNKNKGVVKILFNPEGTTLQSFERFGGISLWDIPTRSIKNKIGKASSVFPIMLYSPDGLISASIDGKEVHLWDTITGQSKNILKAHSEFIRCISFSTDGKMIASGSGDGTILLWDVVTGTRKHTLTGPMDSVTKIKFSPDDRTLVSVSRQKTIKLWDTETGEIRKYLAHLGRIRQQVEDKENVEDVFFSPDGSTIAIVSIDKSIRLWDSTSGTLLQTITYLGEDGQQEGIGKKVQNVLFSPDSKSIFSLVEDHKIYMWNVGTGKRIPFLGYTGLISKGSFSPDGRTLATGSYGGKIRVWDVASGKQKKTISNISVRRYRPHDTDNISLNPKGDKIAAGNFDGTISLWNTTTNSVQPLVGQIHNAKDVPPKNVKFSPDGKMVASWDIFVGMNISIWDVTTGKLRRDLKGHTGLIKRVIFSPDSSKLASWSADEQSIRLWDVATGKQKHTLKKHSGLIESVVFSPDGKTVVGGGKDGNLHIWDVATGKHKKSFTNQLQTTDETTHIEAVSSILFNSDGNTIVSGTEAGTILLWDVSTGQIKQTLKGHVSKVTTVAFSPDEQTLISTGNDGTARLWDISTGEQIQTLAGYKNTKWYVFFYTNGLPLAIDIKGEIGGVDDEIIRLWDLRTGEQIKILPGHSSWVTNLCFSIDGNTLASLSFDETVLLWDLTLSINKSDVNE